ARRISEVEQLGLASLMLLDEGAQEQEQAAPMRLALRPATPARPRGLYPEYCHPEGRQEDGAVGLHQEAVSYDCREVRGESPSEMPDEECEAIKQMLGSKGITVGTPVGPQEGLEDAPGLMEPDEPEWT